MQNQTVAHALDVTTLGSGPRVVFVHGSVVGAATTWRHQRALSEHWTVCLPDRPGFGRSPPLARGDFEEEAPLIAALLGDGAHLVGHSYGAVIALLAAALRPGAVRSLTVSEPGSLRVAAGNPEVDEMIAGGIEFYARRAELGPADFLRMFRANVNSAHQTPDELPDELMHGARLLMQERPPWEVELPLEQLARLPCAKLVISGGHSNAFDAVCDSLAQAIGARRAVLAGRGHTIPSTGAAYNSCLHAFLTESERRAAFHSINY